MSETAMTPAIALTIMDTQTASLICMTTMLYLGAKYPNVAEYLEFPTHATTAGQCWI